jgi:hypothetical protein
MSNYKKANNGRWYFVPSLSLEEKVRLGFDSEVVEDIKKENSKKKESPAKKGKRTKKD